jgi:hypothetical protein
MYNPNVPSSNMGIAPISGQPSQPMGPAPMVGPAPMADGTAAPYDGWHAAPSYDGTAAYGSADCSDY